MSLEVGIKVVEGTPEYLTSLEIQKETLSLL